MTEYSSISKLLPNLHCFTTVWETVAVDTFTFIAFRLLTPMKIYLNLCNIRELFLPYHDILLNIIFLHVCWIYQVLNNHGQRAIQRYSIRISPPPKKKKNHTHTHTPSMNLVRRVKQSNLFKKSRSADSKRNLIPLSPIRWQAITWTNAGLL